MRAMRINQAGALLISAEVPKPEPGPGEVLIQVHAAGITSTELAWYTSTRGRDGSVRTGAVPGHEFSGIVAALGKDVQGLNVGDEVFGMNDWFADGALAEFCVTQPQNIAAKPKGLTHQAAATVPISALTAWQGLFDHAAIQAGERILIHGGAGAVGLFAVQMAHRLGAHVITTVSTRDGHFVRRLGADEVVNYRATRFEEAVRKVDAVFDTVGGETLNRSWSLLKDTGRMVTVAVESEASSDPRAKEAFFIVEPNQRQLTEIANLIEAGHLKTFVKAALPLNDAAAAYDGSLKRGSGRGKMVITVSERQ